MEYHEAAEFVRQWQSASSIQQFCEATGIDRRDASNAAANFRRRGVPLKLLLARRTGGWKKNISERQYRELAVLAERLNELAIADNVRRKCASLRVETLPRKENELTRAELDKRLERLSDEDLQAIANQKVADPILRHLVLHNLTKWLIRMAREILDLRQQLALMRGNVTTEGGK